MFVFLPLNFISVSAFLCGRVRLMRAAVYQINLPLRCNYAFRGLLLNIPLYVYSYIRSSPSVKKIVPRMIFDYHASKRRMRYRVREAGRGKVIICNDDSFLDGGVLFLP